MKLNRYSYFEMYCNDWPEEIIISKASDLPGFPYSKRTFQNYAGSGIIKEERNVSKIPHTIKKSKLIDFLMYKKESNDNRFVNRIRKALTEKPMSKRSLISMSMEWTPANIACRLYLSTIKSDCNTEIAISMGRRRRSAGNINDCIRFGVIYDKDGILYCA